MKKKYYINKHRHLKTLKVSGIIGLTSLLTLIALNFMTTVLGNLMIVPFILGGAILISVFSFYRTIFLVKLPLIIIDDKSIQYFNILWYNKHRWDRFEIAFYNSDELIISIGLVNGRVFDRFILSSLTQSDIEEIVQTFKTKNKLTEY